VPVLYFMSHQKRQVAAPDHPVVFVPSADGTLERS
jgi:hypothetical protein